MLDDQIDRFRATRAAAEGINVMLKQRLPANVSWLSRRTIQHCLALDPMARTPVSELIDDLQQYERQGRKAKPA